MVRSRLTIEEKKEKARWSRIKRVYGIERNQYEALRNSSCPICLRAYSDTIKPVVDHNHKTGEIRGVICAYCNHRIVGRHTDSDLLYRVACYLSGPHTGLIVPKKKRKTRRKKR